jgi:hypothetical protein
MPRAAAHVADDEPDTKSSGCEVGSSIRLNAWNTDTLSQSREGMDQMNDAEIAALKQRVADGGVWWRDFNTGVCKPVKSVQVNWVEFPDQPDLTEPAAMLADGGTVALFNVIADSFVTLMPCLRASESTPQRYAYPLERGAGEAAVRDL